MLIFLCDYGSSRFFFLFEYNFFKRKYEAKLLPLFSSQRLGSILHV